MIYGKSDFHFQSLRSRSFGMADSFNSNFYYSRL